MILGKVMVWDEWCGGYPTNDGALNVELQKTLNRVILIDARDFDADTCSHECSLGVRLSKAFEANKRTTFQSFTQVFANDIQYNDQVHGSNNTERRALQSYIDRRRSASRMP